MGNTLATPAVSALAPRTVIADPGDNPGISKVRPGGILVWTNRSTSLPNFALVFEDNDGRGPASPGDTLFGTGSIVVHVGSATGGNSGTRSSTARVPDPPTAQRQSRFPFTLVSTVNPGPASGEDSAARWRRLRTCPQPVFRLIIGSASARLVWSTTPSSSRGRKRAY
jgi:hypothetical protein